MRLQGAVIKEQGVTFAVVIVKPHVIDNTIEANQMIAAIATGVSGVARHPDGSGLSGSADLLWSQRPLAVHGERTPRMRAVG